MDYCQIHKKIIEENYPKLQGMFALEFSQKENEHAWSKIQILGHLVDSATNNHRRFLQAGIQDHLIFDGYDQDQSVIDQDYQNKDKREIIELWKWSNLQLNQVLKTIDDERKNRITTKHNFHKICMQRISEGQETSLSYLIWDYIYHLEHHLAQLISNYCKQLTDYKKEAI